MRSVLLASRWSYALNVIECDMCSVECLLHRFKETWNDTIWRRIFSSKETYARKKRGTLQYCCTNLRPFQVYADHQWKALRERGPIARSSSYILCIHVSFLHDVPSFTYERHLSMH